jgi:hypothetical protein
MSSSALSLALSSICSVTSFLALSSCSIAPLISSRSAFSVCLVVLAFSPILSFMALSLALSALMVSPLSFASVASMTSICAGGRAAGGQRAAAV